MTDQLTAKKDYNNDTDSFIATSYFDSLKNLSLIHTDGTSLDKPVDVSFLHGLIEKQLDVSHEHKGEDGKDNICFFNVNGNKVEFITR